MLRVWSEAASARWSAFSCCLIAASSESRCPPAVGTTANTGLPASALPAGARAQRATARMTASRGTVRQSAGRSFGMTDGNGAEPVQKGGFAVMSITSRIRSAVSNRREEQALHAAVHFSRLRAELLSGAVDPAELGRTKPTPAGGDQPAESARSSHNVPQPMSPFSTKATPRRAQERRRVDARRSRLRPCRIAASVSPSRRRSKTIERRGRADVAADPDHDCEHVQVPL
jgi:hypothetical protein